MRRTPLILAVVALTVPLAGCVETMECAMIGYERHEATFTEPALYAALIARLEAGDVDVEESDWPVSGALPFRNPELDAAWASYQLVHVTWSADAAMDANATVRLWSTVEGPRVGVDGSGDVHAAVVAFLERVTDLNGDERRALADEVARDGSGTPVDPARLSVEAVYAETALGPDADARRRGPLLTMGEDAFTFGFHLLPEYRYTWEDGPHVFRVHVFGNHAVDAWRNSLDDVPGDPPRMSDGEFVAALTTGLQDAGVEVPTLEDLRVTSVCRTPAA